MNNVSVRVMTPEEILEKITEEKNLRLSVKLAESLSENGVVVSVFEDNFGEVQVCNGCVDFSEHDKKVTEEKDAQIRELKRQIEDLEEIIADGKKPDISVSENGVSVGCECGGYHLAKERIVELEKEIIDKNNSIIEKNERIIELLNEIEEIKKDWCFARMSELEDRHQSDCIEINRLNVALEVITEKYMKLREVHGL